MNAYVRAVPSSYAQATRADPGPADIDVALARAQHDAYVAGLQALGFAVTLLPASNPHPDCVFIEDTAVVARGRALVTRSANPQRVGEGEAVAVALGAAGLDVVRLAAGTLDGGDVLEIGDLLLVGRSGRTDPAGIAGLRLAFEPLGLRVQEVPLPAGVLHLKCVCSAPADDAVLAVEGLRLDLPPEVRIARVPEAEAYASNTVGLGGRALVAAGYPATAGALRSLGLEPVPLEVSEFRKGDGSLTCLSLRVRG